MINFILKHAIRLLENNGYYVEKKYSFEEECLNEMAVDRKYLQSKAVSQFRNILENWCLLKYVSTTNEKTELRKHWRTELIAALSSVSNLKLAKGNNRNTVLKAINEIFLKKEEYHTRNFGKMIQPKFEEENIICDYDHFGNLFKNELFIIINILAYYTDDEIYEYVQHI